jgi:hypothetical protein
MVIPVVAVLARALPAAYAQALQNAKKAGVDAAPSAANSILRKTVSRSEALQILNLTEKQAVASPEVIQKVCNIIVYVRYACACAYALRVMYVVDAMHAYMYCTMPNEVANACMMHACMYAFAYLSSIMAITM